MFKSIVILAAIASASAFAPAPRSFVQRSALSAEPQDKDYEAELKKLQKDAEERLDDKVSDLMKNIEKVGVN